MRTENYLYIFLGTALFSTLLVYLFKIVAFKFSLVDAPDGMRKLQQYAVPKIGGAALISALSIVLIILTWMNKEITLSPLLWILLPALGAASIGLFDDFHPMSPWPRLLILIFLVVPLWLGGTKVEIFSSDTISFLLTVFWVLAITNAVNMIDNSDGLAGGIVFVSSLGIGLISILFGQFLVASLALALSGSALGFLRHNWFPARIYLGDAGAYFFGFMLAVLAIRLKPVAIDDVWGWLIAILLLLMPLTDLFFVIIRRISEGKHIFTAGRDHLAHLLVDFGLNSKTSVLVLIFFELVGVLFATVLVLTLR